MGRFEGEMPLRCMIGLSLRLMLTALMLAAVLRWDFDLRWSTVVMAGDD